MKEKGIRILVTGDLVVTENYPIDLIDGEVIKLFQSSDFNVINLESPITSNAQKGFKLGPYLKGNRASTKSVLKQLNVHLATLANNHILDYGEEGLNDTINFLEENNIEYVGAGKTKKEASTTLFKEIEGIKIAFINVAENEWSSADDNSGGAHPFDLIDNVKKIHQAKHKGYKVILIIHGGLEYYNYPIPSIKKTYRFFAEQGADMVVSHHTHCIGGYEVYNNVPIYYSLGNFLFTKKSRYADWYSGQILMIEYKDGCFKTELKGVKQECESYRLSLLTDSEKVMHDDRVEAISEIILDNKALGAVYDDMIESKTKIYLDFFSIVPFLKSGIFLKIFKKLKLNFHTRYSAAFMLNLIRCETHLSVSKSVFKKYIRK